MKRFIPIALIALVAMVSFGFRGGRFRGARTVSGDYTFTDNLIAKTGRGATLVIAASNSSTTVKNQADYVCDGTADEVEIQAAIDALPDFAGALRGGGTVILLEGLYNISSTIDINTGIHLKGQGADLTCLKLTDNADCNMFEFADPVDGLDRSLSIIERMKLDGNRTNQTTGVSAIHLNEATSATDVRMFDIWFWAWKGNAIVINCLWNHQILFCTFEGLDTHAIRIEPPSAGDRATMIWISDNMYMMSGAGKGGFISAEGPSSSTRDKDLIISNNQIRLISDSMIVPIQLTNWWDVSVTGNIFYGGYKTNSILLEGVESVNINDNIFNFGASAIVFQGTDSIENVSITGNTFRDWHDVCINNELSSGSLEDVSITNNSFYSGFAYNAINCGLSNGLLISNNSFGGYGSLNYEAVEMETATNVQVKNNWMGKLTVTPITWDAGATHYIRGNAGFNRDAFGRYGVTTGETGLVVDMDTANNTAANVIGIDMSGSNAIDGANDYWLYMKSNNYWKGDGSMKAVGVYAGAVYTTYHSGNTSSGGWNAIIYANADYLLNWNTTKKGDFIIKDGNNVANANVDFFQVQDSTGAAQLTINNKGGIKIGAGSVVIDSSKISGTDLHIFANGDATPFVAAQ